MYRYGEAALRRGSTPQIGDMAKQARAFQPRLLLLGLALRKCP